MSPALATTATVTLHCADCRTRHTVQTAHLDNLLAAGPWHCRTRKDHR